SGSSLSHFDPDEVWDAVAEAFADAPGEVLRAVGLVDRCPRLEQKVLVAARAIKNMHLDASSPRLTHLDPEQVRDTVAVVVGHHPSSEMLSPINRLDRRAGLEQEVLVAARAIKNMHLDAASPRLTHLD